jgi:hypothetical protein
MNKIHLYDQALAFIKKDAWETAVHDKRFPHMKNGVNAYESLAKEFEEYWRDVIGQEVAKAFGIDMMNPDVLLLTIWKKDL